jgi:parallel beta-helix repeat protein
VEGATVDLNGHTVFCDPDPAGIQPTGVALGGTAAELRDGVVRGCDPGVLLNAPGGHVVENVIVVDSGHACFEVGSESPGNRLRGNVALRSGGDGFSVGGDGSILEGNIAIENESNGFFTSVGDGKHKFTRNFSVLNETNGFLITRARNKLGFNAAHRIGGQGFEVNGSRQRPSNSLAVDNGGGGIAGNGTGCSFVKNSSLANPAYDLHDSHVDCDENQWRDNLFGAATPAAWIE